LDHVEPAFGSGPATRAALIAAAEATGARAEVVDLLRRLPEGTYRTVRDLWQELADVPIGS
jgi:uncharacterized protein DUF2795